MLTLVTNEFLTMFMVYHKLHIFIVRTTDVSKRKYCVSNRGALPFKQIDYLKEQVTEEFHLLYTTEAGLCSALLKEIGN